MGKFEEAEIVICAKQQIFVYKIPAIKANIAPRASEWQLSEPQWAGRMRILARDKECRILLEDSSTGNLFAACPVNAFPTPSIQNVSDSSRYFVLKVVDDKTGKHAFVGIGFAERSDSFDFSTSLQDFFTKDAKIEKLKNEFKNQPKRDFTLKTGETIKWNLNANSVAKKPTTAADNSKINFKTINMNSGNRIRPTANQSICQVNLPTSNYTTPSGASSSPVALKDTQQNKNDLLDIFGDDSVGTAPVSTGLDAAFASQSSSITSGMDSLFSVPQSMPANNAFDVSASPFQSPFANDFMQQPAPVNPMAQQTPAQQTPANSLMANLGDFYNSGAQFNTASAQNLTSLSNSNAFTSSLMQSDPTLANFGQPASAMSMGATNFGQPTSAMSMGATNFGQPTSAMSMGATNFGQPTSTMPMMGSMGTYGTTGMNSFRVGMASTNFAAPAMTPQMNAGGFQNFSSFGTQTTDFSMPTSMSTTISSAQKAQESQQDDMFSDLFNHARTR